MTKLYLAYGSNLNLSQMAFRCPDAKQLGSLYIPNWKLVFRGVADIEQSRNSDDRLPVGLWEITKQCEQALDLYEGYPNLYDKINIMGMMTYTMNRNNISPPSRAYFHSILEGYKDFGLDTSHLYDSLGWSHYQQKEEQITIPSKSSYRLKYFSGNKK